MDFCLEKVSEASFDKEFQKEILLVAKKVNEIIELDFIDEIQDLVENKDGDEFNFEERKRFVDILKTNIQDFLVCHQLWKKFGTEFYDLERNTLKFAVHFKNNKAEGFIKEIEKKISLTAKVITLQKTYF